MPALLLCQPACAKSAPWNVLRVLFLASQLRVPDWLSDADAAIPAFKTRTSSLESLSRKLNTAWKCGLGELGPPSPHLPDLHRLHRKGFRK